MVRMVRSIRDILKIMMLLLLINLVINGCQSTKTSLSEKIINEIDGNCKINGTCVITMKEITDFKWDKMVVFGVGTSAVEVSQALGLEYTGSTDLMSGMIFVLNNKVVHEELEPYYPEQPSQLQYAVTKKQLEPNCVSYTVDEANLLAIKEEIDGRYYYQITNRSKYKN